MREVVLCFPLKADQVLLGHKKTGFGKGNIVGIGGGIEANETPEQTALRELQEETSLVGDPEALSHRGQVTFLFPTRENWDMRVQLFVLEGWTGNPIETAEIRPEWFALDRIPFDLMWVDAQHWLLRILQGEHLSVLATYQDDLTQVEIQITLTGPAFPA
ncbi:8-oxo-dGTP diphosphatase [Deinococcus misasensis]|uniref:8-oxo-dGTP diphosphatase n=1 Tax=Deinococcus misasensis TaxID=392413 RepID=UPI00054F9F0F|nr:NUDIX domain-containing protein [Deinococcus misasensis]